MTAADRAPDDDAIAAVRARYVDALLDGNAIAARAQIDEALTLLPAAEVYLQLVGPALHIVGEAWERARASVAEEHLATSVSEVVLADLAGRLERAPRRNRTAIVACGPGEMHAVGSRIVADFLDADGWDVLHLGAMTPGQALAELVVARNAAVVAISVALPTRIPEVAETTRLLRALPFAPVVAVGGQAFGGRAELALRAGADVVAASPPELVGRLGERFARG
ncbi:MAG TPA: cobalamin-dependent protein [Conexibacter sp.]|nr:cobalamin-dependent protein [Conexibacter sp.]